MPSSRLLFEFEFSRSIYIQRVGLFAVKLLHATLCIVTARAACLSFIGLQPGPGGGDEGDAPPPALPFYLYLLASDLKGNPLIYLE